MHRKLVQIVVIVFLTLLLLGVVVAVVQGAGLSAPTYAQTSLGNNVGPYSLTAGTQLTPTRFLTVTSTSDPEDGSPSPAEVATTATSRNRGEVSPSNHRPSVGELTPRLSAIDCRLAPALSRSWP